MHWATLNIDSTWLFILVLQPHTQLVLPYQMAPAGAAALHSKRNWTGSLTS